MKRTSLFIYLALFINFSFSQNNSSEIKIKSITKTETYTNTSSDGKKYVFTSEINQTTYNREGKKISNIRNTYFNGKPYKTLITDYQYDDNGRIKLENNFVVEDSLKYFTNYDYQNNQLAKKSFRFIENEKENEFFEAYTYNKNHKLISSLYFYSKKDIDSDFYQTNLKVKSLYDKNEKCVEMDWTKSDSSYKYNKYKYKWNRKNLITKEKEYDKNGSFIKTTSYKYSFDQHNNWIVKKLYVKKELVKTFYREIEYYE